MSSRAISATMGAAPVPVPPPSPAVMHTMSAPERASRISLRLSSAARQPMAGSAPAPRPLVRSSPMWMVLSASERSRACRSVLMAMNSTPLMPSSTIRLTALFPPPPTPTTFMLARNSDPRFVGMFVLQKCAAFIVRRDARGLSSYHAYHTTLRLIRNLKSAISCVIGDRNIDIYNFSFIFLE